MPGGRGTPVDYPDFYLRSLLDRRPRVAEGRRSTRASNVSLDSHPCSCRLSSIIAIEASLRLRARSVYRGNAMVAVAMGPPTGWREARRRTAKESFAMQQSTAVDSSFHRM